MFGEPGERGIWSWRFGGHHVSLNFLVADGEVRGTTPCFLGADPAESPLLGPHPLRPLAGAEDLARDLVRSLDETQAEQALLTGVAPIDVVGGNRPRIGEGDLAMRMPDTWRGRFTEPGLADQIEAIQRAAEQRAGMSPEDDEAVRLTTRPKGVAATDLRPVQQDQLRALLEVYLRRVPDELAEREAAKFAGDRLAELHFAWAGGTERRQPHYYRVQAPRLLVEYDTQSDVNHVHSVWRDPEGDFGFDALRLHRSVAHR